MRAIVCKQFDFPAAHANMHHDGHCSNLHGHTWTLDVFARGTINEDMGKPDYGMVIDFERLKGVYREEIEPFVEHQNLNETLAHLSEFTTEIIAGWILKQLHTAEPRVFKVRLHEGKTSFVEVDLKCIGLNGEGTW